jgi:eukaryotic-like serine/threonine-protein kinase
MTTTASLPRLGTVVGGKYRLVEVLGRGGMGAVFGAERVSDGARVALKRIDEAFASDSVACARFAREARAASAAASEHIVQVFDTGVDDGCPFLVMERLWGEDLGARLRRTHHLAHHEAVDVARQVLLGLERAHAAGVVHRDLKPDNVFLADRAGGRKLVKIVDFGMSKMHALGRTTPLSLTVKGVAVGTPLYMSPEQAAAKADVDERSDLYSVGAILFECVTGRPPYVGESNELVMAAIRTTHAPAVRDVAPKTPLDLAAVIDRALSFERDDRFSSTSEMRAALEACHIVVPRASKGGGVWLWVLGVLALGLGVGAAFGIAWLAGGGP